MTDSSGNETAINAYDEYGNPADPGSLTTKGRFRYTGQAWLPELGFAYYKARMYNSALGRFMQTDPIGYGDGMNMYRYVHNDPVNFVDPTGLDTYICDTTTNSDGSFVRVCYIVTGMIVTGYPSKDPNTIRICYGDCTGYFKAQHGGGNFPTPAGCYGTVGTRIICGDQAVQMNACRNAAFAKHGASGFIDAVSVVPGGGEAGDVLKVVGATATMVIGVFQNNGKAVALSGTGGTLEIASLNKGELNKYVGAAIPGVSMLVGGFATRDDFDEYNKDVTACMAK